MASQQVVPTFPLLLQLAVLWFILVSWVISAAPALPFTPCWLSFPRGTNTTIHILGIVQLMVGIYFLYNGLSNSGMLSPAAVSHQDSTLVADTVPLQASSSAGALPPQEEMRGNLRWFHDFALAQEHARREHKPLFVDFYATWCANCKAFDHLTRRDVRLNTALQQVVLVKIYDTDAGFRTFQHDPQFPELGGVGGQPFLPLFAIYTPLGELAWKGQNYEAVETMVRQLEQAKRPATP